MNSNGVKHILKAEQFTDPKYLNELFASADVLRMQDSPPREEGLGEVKGLLSSKIVATLFFEPSTRTRLSFEAAALRLGAKVLSTENGQVALSGVKGESLEDTIKIVSSYSDAIVIRHAQIGSADRAAAVSSVPIINAGDGAGSHPTQALLDLYTIKKELGRIDSIKIAMVGDLLYGRTVHSLLPLLGLYKNITVYLVSPAELKLPGEYRKAGIEFIESQNLDAVLPEADVLYVTRIQKERFANEADYQKLKGSYVINSESLKKLKSNAIIMHPLPRVDEIAPEVDVDPRAAYFRQAKNGLYLRMALLQDILS